MFDHVKGKELQDALRRFLKKVDDYSSVDKCWNWTASINRSGYGSFGFKYQSFGAHVFSYYIMHGYITSGLEVHHICDNKRCVNPLHLEEVTHSTNIKRIKNRRARKPQTHCFRGHPLSGSNVYYYYGHRHCKACGKIRHKNQHSNLG